MPHKYHHGLRCTPWWASRELTSPEAQPGRARLALPSEERPWPRRRPRASQDARVVQEYAREAYRDVEYLVLTGVVLPVSMLHYPGMPHLHSRRPGEHDSALVCCCRRLL